MEIFPPALITFRPISKYIYIYIYYLLIWNKKHWIWVWYVSVSNNLRWIQRGNLHTFFGRKLRRMFGGRWDSERTRNVIYRDAKTTLTPHKNRVRGQMTETNGCDPLWASNQSYPPPPVSTMRRIVATMKMKTKTMGMKLMVTNRGCSVVPSLKHLKALTSLLHVCFARNAMKGF